MYIYRARERYTEQERERAHACTRERKRKRAREKESESEREQERREGKRDRQKEREKKRVCGMKGFLDCVWNERLPRKSPIISGSFVVRDLQLNASMYLCHPVSCVSGMKGFLD